MAKEMITSIFTGKPYDLSTSVRIINFKQASAYWNNGIAPLDIYPSRNFSTGEPCIVFVFDRERTQNFYDLWCKKELT